MNLEKWRGAAPSDFWDAFDSLRGEMERALDPFMPPDAAGLLDRTTAPAVDVIETEDAYKLLVDVPGVRRDDLELNITGTLLSIKGDKKADTSSEKKKFFRKETWLGSFSRTIDLPARIDPEKVSAELKDGVLSVRVAKLEEAKTKQISVTVR